jgi:hypothetical protein
MARLEQCITSFTVFAVDGDQKVTGVLTRGDILRCLLHCRNRGSAAFDDLIISDAMTPRIPKEPDGRKMLYIEENGPETWYEQLTRLRQGNRARWIRIKLFPVLSDDMRLVNVLDVESPRTRARLEAVVMAEAFDLERSPDGSLTDDLVAKRRQEFDSVHYTTHRKKVTGLANVLLKRTGGMFAMLDDIFNNSRADEIVQALYISEEWLKGYVSDADMKKEEQEKLLENIGKARQRLVTLYSRAATTKYFPADANTNVYTDPQLIVVLGCEGQEALCERAAAAVDVLRWMECDSTTMVLSGGGFGHYKSEAERMLEKIEEDCRRYDSSSTLRPKKDGWHTLMIRGKTVTIALEEDSLDTLGNAVLSWLTLKLLGTEYSLTADDPNRLKRLVLVTDALHAPRSHDIFRRVFAFRPNKEGEEGPSIVVRTVDRSTTLTPDQSNTALEHLRSEARVNAEIFRLVNPLTNGYDVIGNGHVRSILAQMLRLHNYYKGRWDLVRKYRHCWHDEATLRDAENPTDGGD